jgi:uncharacterized protein YkwD
MLCLFLLEKDALGIKSGLSGVIEGVKSFTKSIIDGPKKDPKDIYNQIQSQDFIGDLSGTSSNSTTVKSYVQESVVEKPKPKISIDGIIYYTNLEREKVGLKPLVKNTNLNRSASEKVDDMFNKQYFEHVSPDKKTVADLVNAIGYKYQIVGENLALGIFDNDKDLVRAWMNSPLHKENILNPKYTEIGVAVGISDYKKQKQWMAVQHFAKPMPICTEIDTVVQDNIDKEKTALETEERELQKMAGIIESDPSQVTVDRAYLNNYNTMVNNYNERLNKLRDAITRFNKTIVDYNTCLKNN